MTNREEEKLGFYWSFVHDSSTSRITVDILRLWIKSHSPNFDSANFHSACLELLPLACFVHSIHSQLKKVK